MKKTDRYHIVREKDIPALEQAVNTYIETGWDPFGNLFVIGPDFCQAMVRYADD